MPIASEADFLALIDGHFTNRHSRVPLMRGDDAAILATPERLCLTTDLFIEDAHFRKRYFSPEDIGHKALAVNLSDAAAMGAAPSGFSLGLAGPAETETSFWAGVLRGMSRLAGRFDLPLVGGDLNASPLLVLAVTLWAEPGPSGRLLTRTCAPGDILFLIGPVGLARVGLSVLETHGPGAATDWPAATTAHLRPEPRVAEGLILAGIPGVSGLMDVSDGLARDLPRLLGPNLGADIELPADSLPSEVLNYARKIGCDPAQWAFTGGEDFALLGAASPQDLQEAKQALPGLRLLGSVADRPGIHLNGRPAATSGFDHFTRT